MFGFLNRRREARERVQREATDLITFMGEAAYDEARNRARVNRAKGNHTEEWIWSKAAVEIAKRSGFTIGEKVAERYEAPPFQNSAEREIIAGLVDISRGIADLAKGQGNAMTLHNVQARVLQLRGLVQASDKVRHAAADLIRAADALAAHVEESQSSLAAGVYPPRAESAGDALQRYRSALLRREPF